jgi:RimJ/RimL family protein N-acetyltransferase
VAVITTERLFLRSWREEDVEPFIRHTNTPAVMRWLGGVRDEAQVREMLTAKFNAWQAQRGFTFWAVERRSDGELLGFCGLKIADDPGTRIAGMHEVGWRLREDAWGQGYAKEAATASIDFAFGPCGADQVVALTVAGNEPSWGLMERLGMMRRPELDYEGPDWAETPVIVYMLSKDQWQARTS